MNISNNKLLNELSKEDLLNLIEIYSKNWLALDGVWFQSIEKKWGMDEAIYHDKEAWKRFTVIEAKKIKQFLHLPEHPGLNGLKKALSLRLYANINEFSFEKTDNALVFCNVDCRVQNARKRKGMPFHPCKSVAVLEYEGFAKTIDDRINCECLSCFPDVTNLCVCCSWKFTIND